MFKKSLLFSNLMHKIFNANCIMVTVSVSSKFESYSVWTRDLSKQKQLINFDDSETVAIERSVYIFFLCLLNLEKGVIC